MRRCSNGCFAECMPAGLKGFSHVVAKSFSLFQRGCQNVVLHSPGATVAKNLVENDVELASLDWLQQLGYSTIFGPHLGPGEPSTERKSFCEVVLANRFRA